MRPSDVLMEDSDDDFFGESSFIVTDTRRRRRRRRRGSCLSPRSLLFRWWSPSKKSKGQKIVEVKKSEDVSRRVGLERERKEEVGCSMNGLNGESSSCVSDLKEESEIDEVSASGQFRKEDCFNLAVGFGLLYLIAASKNELNKIIKLRTEMEMLLQNVKEEVENQNMEILCKPSKSNEIIACSAIDAHENLCSNGHVSLQHLLLLKNPADVETTQLYDQSMTCEAIRPEKCMKGIDQLEAELEAELERLQLHLDSDDIFEYPKQQRVEVTIEDTALVGSLSASFEVVVDPPEACTQEHFGVPPNELERRLHELLESSFQSSVRREDMEKKVSLMNCLLVLLVLGLYQISMASMEKMKKNVQKKTYIVHMAKSEMPASFNDHTHWYDSSLKSVSDSAEMLYTYSNVVHGFSTRLTADEAQSLENQPGILSVLPEMKYELHTTRSPQFLGLDKTTNLFPQSNSVSDVIVGVLDTGVWPESKSYDDTGLGPIPSSWNGACESGTNFTTSNCNRKLIGARYFSRGYEATLGSIDISRESKSPRDDDGHGSHTSSTAAGSVVANASLFGYAAGTARGMAAGARLAVYKVCWIGGCFSSDILAGMDKAIDDNVNVLSLSLGGGMSDYYRDSVAIGAFAAMEKGILVSCSAGNAGPSPYSLSNVAPWITTVGAGTLDRDFPAYVSLGNGMNYSGVSLYKGESLPSKMLPFVYAGNASNSTSGNLCMTGTLIPEKVRGKIVMCDRGVSPRVQKGAVVKAAGGAGMVLANTAANGDELVADAHLLPATTVGQKSGDSIKNYLFSDPNPMATILFEGTKVGIEPSPVVAAFSSRGPNLITPEILKPDFIAPGVNIIAGWSGSVAPTGLVDDTRRVGFNIISGTSMSCPHVSGLAALLKAAHPEWSPGAIRSALMTTAYTAYKNGNLLEDIAVGKPSTAFDHGAGHVDPVSALNPGLVYDLDVNDYLGFLCALNYTASQISTLARTNFTCDPTKKYSLTDLNYPSFSVALLSPQMGNGGSGGGGSTVVKFSRTLTNVGSPATYNVSINLQSKSVKASIVPESLSFTQSNEKKSYTVTFTAGPMPSNSFEFGYMKWSDGNHIVGSPIAISWT